MVSSYVYSEARRDGYEELHIQTREIKADMELQVKSDMENLTTMARFAATLYEHGEGFNLLTKEVILYGSDVLSKNRYDDCYGKALKVRRVVADKYNELMKQYDAILAPVCSKNAYEAYDINDAFMTVFNESVFTAMANLLGTPALVSGGVQLMGEHFGESTLLSLAGSVERAGE